MNNLEQILNLVFHRVSPASILAGEIKYYNFSVEEFVRLAKSYVEEYSETELHNMWLHYQNIFLSYRDTHRMALEISDVLDVNVFEALFYYVDKILIIQNNKILCRYDKLLNWRALTFGLSEDLLVCAFLAKVAEDKMKERGYSWETVIGHNNYQLNSILERGISENHFHLFGSTPMFHISWISLMNNLLESKFSEHFKQYDLDRRYTNVQYSSTYKSQPLVQQYYQAAIIRLYLFSELVDRRIRIGSYWIEVEKVDGVLVIPNIVFENRNYDCIEIHKRTINKVCELSGDEAEVDAVHFWGSVIYSELNDGNNNADGVDKLLRENKRFFELIRNNIGRLKRKFIETEFSDADKFYLIDIVKICLKEQKYVNLEWMQSVIEPRIYRKLWKGKTRANIEEILNEKFLTEDYLERMQEIIDSFKNIYTGENATEVEDYALTGVQDRFYGKGEYNDLFSGERWFIYKNMHLIYKKKEDRFNTNLFYAYLVIKENIRSELVQANRTIGFLNFQRYQARKSDLVTDRIFNNEVVRWAVQENLLSGKLKALEIRITPYDSVEKNKEYLQKLNKIIGNKYPQYYYTYHFIKGADLLVENSEFGNCRHYKRRGRVNRIVKAIIGLREQYPHTAEKVLGIDAASAEIGCRPEVFACAYRKLKAHTKVINNGVWKKSIPQLRATYHVGEEFLDVVDGLRAIDETINFLDFENGDRLGHAIVLGIDVDRWYKNKNYKILISQQDYLDNLVWLYHVLIKYDIRGQENLKGYILEQYNYYFHAIYGRFIKSGVTKAIMKKFCCYYGREGEMQNGFNYKITDYYASWELRGDNPLLYKHGFFCAESGTEYSEKWDVNYKFPSKFNVRFIPEVFILNYYYQFNQRVKAAGNKKIQIEIPAFYVRGAKTVQKAMQKEIGNRGIAIETNPSSNYLISSIGEYEEHPIFDFYNKGLTYNEEKLRDCPQLSVSVNTDDLGVFSTSLENEYALLACALERKKDENGSSVYSKDMVYEWIDNVRKMGNDQSFLRPAHLKALEKGVQRKNDAVLKSSTKMRKELFDDIFVKNY